MSESEEVTDAAALAAVDRLQLRYARALDDRHMKAWQECFADPGAYLCTSRENEEQKLPIALMMDDSRGRIADRVRYVTEVWAGTFEDYRTRHFVQRVACAKAADGTLSVESNFMVAYTTTQGVSELLVTGVYFDEMAPGAEGLRFRSKRAVLDTVATPRYLVYPV